MFGGGFDMATIIRAGTGGLAGVLAVIQELHESPTGVLGLTAPQISHAQSRRRRGDGKDRLASSLPWPRRFRRRLEDWCQIGAKPGRTRRTESTSFTNYPLISSREDRLRFAEFAPARDYGSEGYRFESCRARFFFERLQNWLCRS